MNSSERATMDPASTVSPRVVSRVGAQRRQPLADVVDADGEVLADPAVHRPADEDDGHDRGESGGGGKRPPPFDAEACDHHGASLAHREGGAGLHETSVCRCAHTRAFDAKNRHVTLSDVRFDLTWRGSYL